MNAHNWVQRDDLHGRKATLSDHSGSVRTRTRFVRPGALRLVRHIFSLRAFSLQSVMYNTPQRISLSQCVAIGPKCAAVQPAKLWGVYN